MGIIVHKILVRNLRGLYNEEHIYYFSREEALNMLKEFYNEDFGYDADAWEQWLDTRFYPNRKRKDHEIDADG